MGERGPVPKRSDQRRRRNKPSEAVKTRAKSGTSSKAKEPAPPSSSPDDVVFEPAPANARWHPVAKRWYESLALSGQSKFYEPSDWTTAFLIAESIDRELKPQYVGLTKDGEPVMQHMPPKGASLAAWLKGMSVLMVTEGDRRRMQLELQRPTTEGEEAKDVSELDEYRRRLHGDPAAG